MLKCIEEFRKYVEIVGFRNVKISSLEAFLKTVCSDEQSVTAIQFLDATLIATWEHVYFAVLNALTAFKNGRNISKTLAMETMLYASAQRQIRKATKLIGIKPKSSSVAVLLVGEKSKAVESALCRISERINGQRDDEVLELSPEKVNIIRESFCISETELTTVTAKDNFEKALINLIIERMALLATHL